MSSCRYCRHHLKRIRVHDDDLPFFYNECPGCGWDDYDESLVVAANEALEADEVVDSSDIEELNLDNEETADEF